MVHEGENKISVIWMWNFKVCLHKKNVFTRSWQMWSSQVFDLTKNLGPALEGSILRAPGFPWAFTHYLSQVCTCCPFWSVRRRLRLQQIVDKKTLSRAPVSWYSRRTASHILPGTALNWDHPARTVTYSFLFSSHSPVTLNSPLIPFWVTRPTSLNSGGGEKHPPQKKKKKKAKRNKSCLLFLLRACTMLRHCVTIGRGGSNVLLNSDMLGPFWSGRRWVWLIHYVNYPIKW